jgi:hypothetical protein
VFNGWDKTVEVVCTKNAEYVAQYYKTHTVVFKNWDDSIISTKTYRENEEITIPSNPTRSADDECSYLFNGWDRTVETICTKNAEYTAQYAKVFTVIFKNWNGAVISYQTYREGEVVVIPANPNRPADENYSYTFTGWDKNFDNVTTDLTVTAQYDITSPAIVVEDVIANVSDGTVEVIISIANNPGISSLKFDVTYDSVLSLSNVVFDSAFGAYVTAPTPYGSPQTITCISPLSEVTVSGSFATLTFDIADTVTEDTVANISLTLYDDEIYDGDWKAVEFDTINGTVTLVSNS